MGLRELPANILLRNLNTVITKSSPARNYKQITKLEDGNKLGTLKSFQDAKLAFWTKNIYINMPTR